MARIIKDSRVILAGPDGTGDPEVGPEEVAFNGRDEQGHESFIFPGGTGFNFTKTASKPYDKVVVACLLAARAHIPEDVLEISSDGDWKDWEEGRELYNQVTGKEPTRPKEMRAPTAEGTEENPPKDMVMESPDEKGSRAELRKWKEQVKRARKAKDYEWMTEAEARVRKLERLKAPDARAHDPNREWLRMIEREEDQFPGIPRPPAREPPSPPRPDLGEPGMRSYGSILTDESVVNVVLPVAVLIGGTVLLMTMLKK